MNVKNLIAAIAVFAAAGSAFAQQTEFVRPDAAFKSSLTRAEVRQDLARATSEGQVASRQHDGQDTVYAGNTRSRQEVKAPLRRCQRHLLRRLIDAASRTGWHSSRPLWIRN